MNSASESGSGVWWRRVLLACCAMLVMTISIPAAAVFPAEYILFQPQPYLDQIERSGFYENYPALAFDLIEAGGELTLPGAANFIKSVFPPDRYESVIRFILPEYWVRLQIERMVRQYWAFYNFESASLRLVLDFRPVKARMNGAEGQALVQAAFQGLPECTVQDVLTMGGLLLKGQTEGFPRCRPPHQIEQPVFDGLQLALKGFTGALPDEMVLMQRSSPDINQMGPGGLYPAFRHGLRWNILFLLMLFALAIVLLDYSWRRFLEWAGAPLYIGGLLAAVLASLMGVGARGLAGGIGGILPATARQVFSLFSGMVLGVFQQFLAWMGVAGVVLAVVGLGLILLSRIRRPSPQPTPSGPSGMSPTGKGS